MGALRVDVGNRRRLSRGEGARAEQDREDRERAGAAGQRECGGGPAAVDERPAPAAPSALPTAMAVASQANASVIVPAGAAASTIAYTAASVGEIAAPASTSTAASASMLPAAGISARDPAVSAQSTSATPAPVRAPPPRRAASRPPANDPAPQRANSGAAAVVPSSVLAAAVTATSTAPRSTPTATSTMTSVRIAGVRSAPPRGRRAGRGGCQLCEAGCAANDPVARSRTTPPTARAAPVDQSAPMQSTSGGPKIQVSSTTDASNA